MADLMADELHGSLADPALTSMNFLNEIAHRFPDAISFAAGRPYEEHFDTDVLPRYLRLFSDHLRSDRGYTQEQVRRTLLQYGRTKGIVHDLVAANLLADEGIEVDPESIVVTVGCQEAMFLVLRALRASEKDVLLAISPVYVGLTGAAKLVDLPVRPVRSGPDGIDLDDLVTQIHRAREVGLRPRACYVMPDFANPSGATLDHLRRRRLLAIAEEENILLLEDNPYGIFNGDAERLPTLKALDTRRKVVYLGSFAKTGLPGARVGYVVADQRVSSQDGATDRLFADELAKIKSMVTVNTSPVAQAVIAGKLIENQFSLIEANAREREAYRRNLRLIDTGLRTRLQLQMHQGISWNKPGGGFFVVVTLPFAADDALLERSARDFGVLWTPMHHFYASSGGENQLRLSISALTADLVETGLDRLAALLADAVGGDQDPAHAKRYDEKRNA
ncbi:PLP-dependent aminotransferase family protein [Amycolatopsis sp. NPDC059657]|uniref:aminotransferase-like domain-containing protein n=1 Tax=Amycolatopsis sp. NPDC059657 TaxID=3346899 RepID=UPI00366AF12A